MFRILIAIADIERRQWLTQCFGRHPEFCLVRNPVTLPAPPTPSAAPPIDIVLVDLKERRAAATEFWCALRFSYPGARLMALYESSLSPLTLKAALHAGAFYLVDWPTMTDRLYQVAQAAGRSECLLPAGPLGETVRSLLHPAPGPNQILRIGGLSLDLEKCQATLDDLSLDLTSLEFRVLVYLAQRAGRVISLPELWKGVWRKKRQLMPTGEPVRSCLKRLKRKLKAAAPDLDYIITKRGLGSRMILEAEWHHKRAQTSVPHHVSTFSPQLPQSYNRTESDVVVESPTSPRPTTAECQIGDGVISPIN